MKTFFETDRLTEKSKITLIVICLTAVLLFNFIFTLFYNFKYMLEVQRYNEQQKLAVDITDLFMSEKLEEVFSNLNVLKDANIMKAYLKDPQNPLEIQEVSNMFSRFAANHPSITQLRILDNNGMERIRVNQVENFIEVVPIAELQDKSDRYYFQHSMALAQSQMYISDFDLNIENNVIVEPYEPTLRFAMRLYNPRGEAMGVLILNYDGVAFLSIIDRYERLNLNRLNIGILDLNNYWSLNHLEEGQITDAADTSSTNAIDAQRVLFQERIEENPPDSLVEGSFSEKNLHYYYRQISDFHDTRFVFEGNDFAWYFVSFYDVDHLLAIDQVFVTHQTPLRVSLSLVVFILTGIFAYMLIQSSNHKFALISSAYISNNSHDGIIIADETRKIIYFNSVFLDIFGYQSEELFNKDMGRVLGHNVRFAKKNPDSDVLWEGNIWNYTKSGNLILKFLTVKQIKNKRGKLIYYIGIYSNPIQTADIASKQTTFFNQNYMSEADIEIIGDKIDHEFSDIDRYMVISVQFLDNIKYMLESDQSTQGKFIATGQNALSTNPAFSVLAIPRSNLMLLIKKIDDPYENNLSDSQQVEEMIHDVDYILKKLKFSLNIETYDFHYHSGVAISGVHGNTGSDLIRNALIALEALTKFKNAPYLIYNETYYDYVKEENIMRNELEHAFDNDEFSLAYQPQINLESNQIVGVEALVRWTSPSLGSVSPDRFVPLLEETEAIFLLGKTVLEKTIHDFSSLSLKKPLRVSINLSGKEFVNLRLIRTLIETIQAYPVPNLSFCFEITESIFVKNLEMANQAIQLLHAHNIQAAIDDFGTGYSSLGYLKQLLADEFKIDRMFIKDFPDRDDGTILKAVIRMGKEINIHLIMEGVETKEQLEFIKRLGCDDYQGYLGYKPMSFDALAEILEDQIENK